MSVKTIELDLFGLTGSTASVLNEFRRQATREKWSQVEIDAVLTEAKNGDKHHTLSIIGSYCQSPEISLEEDDEDDLYNDWMA